MILACVQPSYLAWIPLFKRMQLGDVFVYLDDVQYSKNSFHNRNYIKTSKGKELLTIPIKYKGHTNDYICNMPINNDHPWKKKHWRSIQINYSKAKYFYELKDIIYNEIYDRPWEKLGELNIAYIEIFKNYFDIPCETYKSSEFKLKSSGNQKLVDLCNNLGADTFLVKPGTQHYHPEDFFGKQNIKLLQFQSVPINYNQQYGEFIPDLSALDYAMNCGAGQPDW